MTQWKLEDGTVVSDDLSDKLAKFFSNDPVPVSEIIGVILTDIMSSEILRYTIKRNGNSVIAYSEEDWMNVGISIENLFKKLWMSVPERANPNEVRAEAFIDVVSTRIFTRGIAGTYSKNMTESDVPDSDWKIVPDSGRYLFFETDVRKAC